MLGVNISSRFSCKDPVGTMFLCRPQRVCAPKDPSWRWIFGFRKVFAIKPQEVKPSAEPRCSCLSLVLCPPHPPKKKTKHNKNLSLWHATKKCGGWKSFRATEVHHSNELAPQLVQDTQLGSANVRYFLNLFSSFFSHLQTLNPTKKSERKNDE